MSNDATASSLHVHTHASLKDNLAFTLEQAGAVSGIGRSALYIAVRDGRLPARKCGRRTIVLKDELQAFLQALPKANLEREV